MVSDLQGVGCGGRLYAGGAGSGRVVEVGEWLVELVACDAANVEVAADGVGPGSVEHAERGINVKQAEVMAFLSTRKSGLFVAGRSRSDAGQATAWAIQQGYAANEEGTTDRGFNYIVGKLTPTGQAYAWERIVRFVDSTGSLALEAPARNGVSV